MSYWMDGTTAAVGTRDVPTEACRVVVVGAGVAGISVVHHLRAMGLQGRVVVVEARERVASGATGRNGGHCWPDPNNPVHQGVTRDLVALAAQLGVDAVSVHRGGIELVRPGEDLAEYGPFHGTCELLDAPALHRAVPLLREGPFAHGVLERNATGINGHRLVAAMWARLATDDTVLVHATVAALAPHGVRLDDGRVLAAEHVVLCCNAWTPRLAPSLPVRTLRGQVIRVQLVDDTVPGLPLSLSIDDSLEYVVPDGPRAFVYGGRRQAAPGGEHGVMDDTTLNAHVSAALRDGVGQHFALQPHQWRVTHEWTGIMGFTPDEQPLVGRLHGNCYCAVGFSGNGMVMAFAAARAVAQLITGVPVEPPLPEWDCHRFDGAKDLEWTIDEEETSSE